MAASFGFKIKTGLHSRPDSVCSAIYPFWMGFKQLNITRYLWRYRVCSIVGKGIAIYGPQQHSCDEQAEQDAEYGAECGKGGHPVAVLRARCFC